MNPCSGNSGGVEAVLYTAGAMTDQTADLIIAGNTACKTAFEQRAFIVVTDNAADRYIAFDIGHLNFDF